MLVISNISEIQLQWTTNMKLHVVHQTLTNTNDLERPLRSVQLLKASWWKHWL